MATDDHEKDDSIEDLSFSVGREHITQQRCGCLSFKRDHRHFISTNPPLLPSTNPFSVFLQKCLFSNHMGEKRENRFLHSARSFHSICGVTEWVTKQTRREHMCTPPRPRPLSVLDISIHEHHWLQRRKGGQPCHCAKFEDISCKMSCHH